MAPTPPRKTDTQDAEFTRKLVLGLLSTLETKGLLASAEVESIIRAARQATQPRPAPRPAGPAAPGTAWADRDGRPLGMDRTTPVAIPDVKRAAPPAEPADPRPTTPAEPSGVPRPPMIDLNME